MNGVHDMGGMHGIRARRGRADEPVFHADWERRAFAINLAMGVWRRWNIDMARFAREQMPPAEYLATTLLRALALGARSSSSSARVPHAGGARRRAWRGTSARRRRPAGAACARSGADDVPAAVGNRRAARIDAAVPRTFTAGDHVVAKNMNPIGHTRLPRYARGRRGVVDRDHGVFVFPDAAAAGKRTAAPALLQRAVRRPASSGGRRHRSGTRSTSICSSRYLEPGSTPADLAATSLAPARRGRPGVPRAVGGAGLRHDGGAPRARSFHLARVDGSSDRGDRGGRARGEVDDGTGYYLHWLADSRSWSPRSAWCSPTSWLPASRTGTRPRSTPHGQPIELRSALTAPQLTATLASCSMFVSLRSLYVEARRSVVHEAHADSQYLTMLTVNVRRAQAGSAFDEAALGAIGMKINLYLPVPLSAWARGTRTSSSWSRDAMDASGDGHYAFRVGTARRSTPSTLRRWPPAARTMASPARVRTTVPPTMPRSSRTARATTSRSSATPGRGGRERSVRRLFVVPEQPHARHAARGVGGVAKRGRGR